MSAQPTAAISGRCLCGSIAFEVGTSLDWMLHCHCSICRKAHGTPYGTFVGTRAEGLRWRAPRGAVVTYESSPGNARPFCARCGSRAPSEWKGQVAIPAGLLDGELGLRPSSHIFVDSKAPWWEIADALPRARGPAGAGPEFETRRETEPAPGVLRGACLCGAVAYELDAPLDGAIWCCHCSRCRRAHAAAHGSSAFAAVERFRWLRGGERIRSYKVPEARRYTRFFCDRCGSPVPNLRPGGTLAVIPDGTLEDDPGIRPGRHVHVASKAPWDEIADSLRQFEGDSPDHPFAGLAART